MAQTQTLVKFYTCTQQAYDALTVNDSFTGLSGALYFTSDTKRLYKGSTLYGGSFEYSASNLAGTGNTGTLYYEATTGNIKVYEGGAWVTKFIPYSTTVNAQSTDATVPTSKAVYDAIDAEKTIRTNADAYLSGAIDTLNSNDSTNGSVAKAVKDAKDALSGAIGSNFNSTDTVKKYIDDTDKELSGEISYVSGVVATINNTAATAGSFRAGDAALSSAIGGSYDAENTVADAIAALDEAAISISEAANNAIVVSGEVDKTIGLKINANDKFLTQTSDGLSATISLVKAETLKLIL